MRHLALAAFTALSLSAQDATKAWQAYQQHESPRMVPWLCEVIRFPTVAGDAQAWTDQKAWLQARAQELGFPFKDAGPIFEIELPGPVGSPILGLVAHGDVQPVDASHWSFPPFAGTVKDGTVIGRGAADDKGPLVQALLAMKALELSGAKRTQTIRLLVGSDEESGSSDITTYLKDHKAPDYTLVLDSAFPVVVGEKAWNALTVETDLSARVQKDKPVQFQVRTLSAGLAPSIVPDLATLTFKWTALDWKLNDRPITLSQWAELVQLPDRSYFDGTRKEVKTEGNQVSVSVHGKAAHAGVNAEGGRNALVAMANQVTDWLPESGVKDILAFARLAGQDLTGTGLGLTQTDPVFGKATVVPSLLQMEPGGKAKLTINIRSTPALSGEALKAHLFAQVAAFNAKTGAHLEPGGFFADTPLIFDPQSKLVKRLMADYAKATGEHPAPAISGGGTYAKRLPNSIAFGMWFPGKPYPGHDVDEKVPVADLERGEKVLIETLVDLACSEPIKEPFKP